MYVDDIISGAQDLEEAKALQTQMAELMSRGCFNIHKWHSNVMDILPESNKRDNSADVDLGRQSEVIETLGLVWEPNDDVFVFRIALKDEIRSKREMLSEISKLFDPLGFLGPILTLVKILMQDTWKEDIDWDEALPVGILDRWTRLKTELSTSTIFRIPRRISSEYRSENVTLYGFCDASQDAYGACIYVKIRDKNRQAARLLCSKARIAPIKPISIPRLELCGALLLARLIAQVKQACKFEFYRICAYIDSMTILYWIKGNVSRWKTFVANRVAEITNILPAEAWAHVKSEDNPADLLSRGAFPKTLQTCKLWWAGPHWIYEDASDLCDQSKLMEQDLEKLETIYVKTEERRFESSCHYITKQESILQGLYVKYSNLSKIERVLAYCQRFIRNCQ